MLLGENGAGKTTLLQIAAGLQRADAGTIFIHGTEYGGRARPWAKSAGIGTVHQHFSLVPAMTVAENVALSKRQISARYSPTATARAVAQLAESVGLGVDPHAIAGELSVAAQQRTEILKAIAHEPGVLILDEPTAVLSPADARDLFAWLRSFVASGRTAIVITHRIRDALDHADAVTVLRAGRTVHTAAARDVTEHGLLSAIVGEPSSGAAPPPQASDVRPFVADGSDPALLDLRDVTVFDQAGVLRLSSASVAVHRGEIVGVAGVDGSGHRELLRVLSGRLAPAEGRADVPADVGFVPEDRLGDALIADVSLTENFALRGAGTLRGVLDWPLLAERTTTLIGDGDVRGAGSGTLASHLSGGNQQRFVIARELASNPSAVVAENPTRGLDVRAAASVLSRLRVARARGAAVVIYSSDIEQLVDCCDRVIVCHGGRVREVAPVPEAIAAAMVGAS